MALVLWQVRRVARIKRRRGIEVFDGGDDVGGLRLVIMLMVAAAVAGGNSGAAAVTVWWRGRRRWCEMCDCVLHTDRWMAWMIVLLMWRRRESQLARDINITPCSFDMHTHTCKFTHTPLTQSPLPPTHTPHR